MHKLVKFFSALSLLLVLFALSALLYSVFSKGLSGLSFEFVYTLPTRSGRAGGISSVLVSSAFIVAIAISAALPIGLATAVFLSIFCNHKSLTATTIRVALDILASTPSIVFGLFGSAFFCIYLGLGFSLIAGGLTLSCMILPFIVRFTESSIRDLPSEHLENAFSLGFSRCGVFFRVVLPLVFPSLIAAIVLSIARALSETAALLFTSGYVSRMPDSLYDSGRTMSVHIFDLAMNVPGGENNAYTSALVLLLVLVLINSSTWVLGRQISKKFGVSLT